MEGPIPGTVVIHEQVAEADYFRGKDSSLTFWYALEDTAIENGYLCVAKGSHLTTPIKQRLIKGVEGLPKFGELAAPLWTKKAPKFELEPTAYEYQALGVRKGTLVLFHGNLMHKSGANKSQKNKIACTFSIIEDDVVDCPDDCYMKSVDGDFERL